MASGYASQWSSGPSALRLDAQARRAPPTRRPLANLPSPPCTLPLRVGSPRACSRRRSERHAPDSCRCSSTGARSAGRALRADPQSALTQPLTHIRVLSSLRTTRKKTHEYCELFMIIRCLRIQSHDNLGADVFKLMIISVCCIQTQLIVFMPHAGSTPACRPSPACRVRGPCWLCGPRVSKAKGCIYTYPSTKATYFYGTIQ